MDTNKNADVAKHGVEPRPVQDQKSGQGLEVEVWESQTGSRHISALDGSFDFIINYHGGDILLLRAGRVIAALPISDELVDKLWDIADEHVRGVLWSGGYFSLAPRKEVQ